MVDGPGRQRIQTCLGDVLRTNERRAGHYGDDIGSTVLHSHLGGQARGPVTRAEGPGNCSAGIHDVAAAVECRFGFVRSRHRVPSPGRSCKLCQSGSDLRGKTVALFESLH